MSVAYSNLQIPLFNKTIYAECQNIRKHLCDTSLNSVTCFLDDRFIASAMCQSGENVSSDHSSDVYILATVTVTVIH